MDGKKGGHVVMPHSLAKALMDAGMQHMDLGGIFGGIGSALGIGQPSGGAPVGGLPGQIMGFNQYTANNPNIQQQDLRGWSGQLMNQQQQVFQQQQNLANQLLTQSQGGGPNPAQAQLAQNTGQNVANQSALMASQRGASANPALMARQAAMTGANVQQQGVGQAATLQAQQQLAAQQQLQAQQQAMSQANLNQQGITQGATAAQNTAMTQGQLGASNINANVNAQNAQQSGNIFGNLLNSAGSALSLFNKGGQIPKMADGGIAEYSAPAVETPGLMNYKNFKVESSGGGKKSAPGGGGDLLAGGAGDSIAPSATMLAANGGQIPFSTALLQGGKVPGKAQVPGDSKKNDTEPTLLSPGEIVLPRSVTQSPDMEKKAIEFLRHLKSGKKGYGAVIDARKDKKACGGMV